MPLVNTDFDCMPFRIYLYSVLHVNKGPIKVYTGSKIESFFVKVSEWPSGVFTSLKYTKELLMFSLIIVCSVTLKLYTMQSAISPDGTHILGGSSDGSVYLWQVLVAYLLPAFLHTIHYYLRPC